MPSTVRCSLSDESLVDRMKANLAAHGYRFDSLVETIVMSPQFRNQRGSGTRDADSLRKGELA